MFHIASILSILFLCPRIEWSGHIVYAPVSNDRGILFCPVCLSELLSVCLSVVNFNLHYNIWTVRDRDFIFGMHTPLMMPFQMTPRSMALWFDFDLEAKNSFFDFVATGGAYCSISPVFRRDVWWYGDVRPGLRPSNSPSVRVSVCPFFAPFSFMLWHIELKFCTWLCFNVLRIKFECRHFASIFEGVMSLCELRI